MAPADRFRHGVAAGPAGQLPAGAGIGLRHCHIDAMLSERPSIPWLELLADNHFADGGPTLCHVAARVQRVQERLGMPLVVENVSSYLRFRESALAEAEFLAELSARTDCGLLLDVNNLYVNQSNHGDDLDAALAALPPSRVQELHLAGFAQRDGWLLDAHAAPVAAPVWALYERVLGWLAAAGVGAVPTLIEWDNDIPELGTLRAEAARANAIAARASPETAAVL